MLGIFKKESKYSLKLIRDVTLQLKNDHIEKQKELAAQRGMLSLRENGYKRGADKAYDWVIQLLEAAIKAQDRRNPVELSLDQIRNMFEDIQTKKAPAFLKKGNVHPQSDYAKGLTETIALISMKCARLLPIKVSMSNK